MLAKQPQIEIHLIHTYSINTYLIQSINNVKIKPKLTFTRLSTLNEISRGICFVKSYLVSQGGSPHFQNGGSISFGTHARRLGKPHFPESFVFPGESRFEQGHVHAITITNAFIEKTRAITSMEINIAAHYIYQ